MNFFQKKKKKVFALWLDLVDFSWVVTYFIHASSLTINFHESIYSEYIKL